MCHNFRVSCSLFGAKCLQYICRKQYFGLNIQKNWLVIYSSIVIHRPTKLWYDSWSYLFSMILSIYPGCFVLIFFNFCNSAVSLLIKIGSWSNMKCRIKNIKNREVGCNGWKRIRIPHIWNPTLGMPYSPKVFRLK